MIETIMSYMVMYLIYGSVGGFIVIASLKITRDIAKWLRRELY